MKLRSISTALAFAGLLLGTPGCKDFYDVNVDPIHPTKADLQLLLPVTQTAMATYLGFSIQGLGQPTSALMQQLSNGRGIGTFQQGGDSFSGPWNGLYTDMLVNNELLITQGTTEQRWGYVGVAQLQKAYVMSQLVDMFGDVPYSQALKGVQNLAPRYDKDADIYNGNASQGIQGLFSLINEGLKNVARGGALTNDLIYDGNLAKWASFGRVLKLKLLVQIRKTRPDAAFRAQVDSLLTPADLSLNSASGTPDYDFEFKYGSSASPANRNIGFLQDYVNTARENFIGRYLYQFMKYGNGVNPVQVAGRPTDPRIPYYFFNQLPGSAATNNPAAYDYQDPGNARFVTLRQGSTGPAAASTTSSDTRTLPGLYPVGGRYDDGRAGIANTSFGRGVVAQRLLPLFNRRFLEAEALLTIRNDRTAARQAFQYAVQASFDKVNAIAAAEGTSTTPDRAYTTPITLPFRTLAVIPSSEIAIYLAAALARFDASPNPIQIIMEEKYVASFGMGTDIYTDWRRTGYPIISVPDNANIGNNVGLVEDNDQGTRGASVFPRRLYYSQGSLIANPSAPKAQLQQDDPNYRIFWDR